MDDEKKEFQVHWTVYEESGLDMHYATSYRGDGDPVVPPRLVREVNVPIGSKLDGMLERVFAAGIDPGTPYVVGFDPKVPCYSYRQVIATMN